MHAQAKPTDHAVSAVPGLWNAAELQEHCEFLLRDSPVMFLSLDPEGTILNASKFWFQVTGYEPMEVTGRPLVSFLQEGCRESIEGEVWKGLLHSGFLRSLPLEVVTRSAGIVDVLLSATAQRDDMGRVRGVLAILLDVTTLHQSETEICSRNKFLGNVIESLPHPFYVLDAETYIIKMANSAAKLGPLSPQTTCHALTHRRPSPCTEPEHTCPLAVVKRTGKPVTVEHVHYDRNGKARDYEVHGYPIFDDQGKVIQMIEYSLDITERKQMEKELLENAEKTKLFAYSISHDLKSPLIGIYGLVRLLCKRFDEALDEKGKAYCAQILKTAEHAVALVEEINAYIRAKEVTLEFEAVNPLEVIHMVRDEFGALLGVRQIAWIEPACIPEIRADRKCMLRVFRNLVDNALKYGGDHLTRIEIGYEGSGEFHTFRISDNGVGIQPDAIQKIFDLFQRNESSRGVEGTGLGLAIVKAIAESHRGNVRLESDPGVRTTFHVSIAKDL
jgi:PAS domain S-box-containing protein